MNEAIVKRKPGPATAFRTQTQQVRDTLTAMQRLQEQYWVRQKRNEADLYEGLKKLNDALRNGDVDGSEHQSDESGTGSDSSVA